jgi:ATP-dependent Lon protease
MPHSNIDVPDKLPLYVQQDMVPFPYMVFPVYVNDRDLQIFTEADNYDKLVAVVLRRPAELGGDKAGQISQIGTLCRINQIKKIGDGKFKVTLEGINRVRILETDPTASKRIWSRTPWCKA